MTSSTSDFASWLRETRLEAGLSVRNLEQRSGIPRTIILRLEHAIPPPPSIERLRALAVGLQRDEVDVFAAAGVAPTELPSFAPYLRTRYRELPESARQELEDTFHRIADRYGYQPRGPRPGEDE